MKLPNQAGEAGAVSISQALSAVEASPHDNPCKKRPSISGWGLCMLISIKQPNIAKNKARSETGRRPMKLDKRPHISKAHTAPKK
jgi:hypothetical protein